MSKYAVVVPTMPKSITVLSEKTEKWIATITEKAMTLPELVRDDPTALTVRAVMNEAGRLQKGIEKERKAIGEPLRKFLKQLIDVADPAMMDLDDVVGGCKELLDGYVAHVNAENAKAEAERIAKEDAAQADEGHERPTAALILDTPAPSKPVVQTRVTRHARVIDPSLVPAAYWMLNVPLIEQEALAGVEIPGVEVFSETSIVNK